MILVILAFVKGCSVTSVEKVVVVIVLFFFNIQWYYSSEE